MGKPEENEPLEAAADSVEDREARSSEQGLTEPLLPRDAQARRRRRSPAAAAAAESSPSAPFPDAGGSDGGADEAERVGAREVDDSWWESAARDFGGGGGGDNDVGGYDEHDYHSHHYDGTFVPPPPIVPVAEPVPSDPNMVRIVAPAAFAAGYDFVAMLEDGRAFTVTVEDAEVDEGDELSVPYPREFLATTVVPPTGHWKDGLCACFRFGCCHPMLCLPLFCPFVALGQIMTRMRLTFCANPGPRSRTRNTFKFLICLALLRLSLVVIFGSVPEWKIDSIFKIDSLANRILGGIGLALVLVKVFLTAVTRRRVRQRYDIPPASFCCGCDCCRGCCGDCCGCNECCEDICRAVFCGCCTVAQMGRHTADYETYRGVCCSSTGLPPAAPEV